MHGLMNPPGGVFAKLYKTFLRLLPIPLCYLLQNAECVSLKFVPFVFSILNYCTAALTGKKCHYFRFV